MNKSRCVMRQQKNLFNHSSNKNGITLEFIYTVSNDNLITGKIFERVIHKKFKNLPMFKICFPCTPYLLSGGELLFSNGDYDSWTVRIGNMKLGE
ncbi:16625_t:CDS:1, partial [Racocetra persica]